MHVELLVPDPFWPGRDCEEAMRGVATACLERLVARGRRTAGEPVLPETWLLRRFGVARQRDWPAAPWSLLGDGGTPGADAWMRCDPVHFEVGRSGVALADPGSIEPEEALSLCASINGEFHDRFSVEPLRPERWYLRLAQAPEIETFPTAAALGEIVDERLPRGAGAPAWRATLNAMQMLLHQHPVNQARAARGCRTVNSVWFWGTGRITRPCEQPYRAVFADDPVARGLALESGATHRRLPERAAGVLGSAASSGNALVVLDALRIPCASADLVRWRDRLATLERDWFEPLAAALRHGRIGMITLTLASAAHTLCVEVTRADLRRFWRADRPLAAWRRKGSPEEPRVGSRGSEAGRARTSRIKDL